MEGRMVGRFIGEHYFAGEIGRLPRSQGELDWFAREIEKGIEVSADWRTIHDEAKDKSKRVFPMTELGKLQRRLEIALEMLPGYAYEEYVRQCEAEGL